MRVAPPVAPFAGAKLLLVQGGLVLTYLRDVKPGLGWAGLWDLPGGGREGAETPEDCALRELMEEFGLRLGPERLIWRRSYPALHDPSQQGWFFAGRLTAGEVASVRFGDEGQEWRMMGLAEWLDHPEAVAPLQARSREALVDLGWM